MPTSKCLLEHTVKSIGRSWLHETHPHIWKKWYELPTKQWLLKKISAMHSSIFIKFCNKITAAWTELLLFTKIKYRHHREIAKGVYRFQEEIKLFPTEKIEIEFKYVFSEKMKIEIEQRTYQICLEFWINWKLLFQIKILPS